jgi:hypothetical protein
VHPCLRIDIDKHRHRIDQQHWTDCAFPGVGGDQNLIAGLDANGFEGGLDGDRAGVYALAIGSIVQLGKTSGELGGVLAWKRLPTPGSTA